MATPIRDDEPLELIDRLLAGVVRLLCFAHGRPERTCLERSWWALRSLKHGAEAALTGITATPRTLSRTGRSLLLAHCDAERSNVYRCAAHLGLVPRTGTGTWSVSGGAAPPSGPKGNAVPAGQSFGHLMGL